MSNINRFKLLLLRTWQLSPRWYLFLPAVVFLAINTFGILVDGSDGFPKFGDTQEIFMSPGILFMIFTYSSSISLTIIGVHLISRHFKNNQQKTDSLTLPVSTLQMYIVMFLSCFIILPLFGILSNILVFGFVKLIGLHGHYPLWGWMWPIFSIAVVPYIFLMIPFFALSLIHSRQTILWGLGIGALGAVVIATIANWNPNFMNSVTISVDRLRNLISYNEDVYGPILQSDGTMGISPFFATFSSGWSTMIIFLLVAAILLFVSGWFALKNRQA